MKLWVDDVRNPPAIDGYIWCKTVNETIAFIATMENVKKSFQELATQYGLNARSAHPTVNATLSELIDDVTITLIDIDYDAGDYVREGGDYIKVLDWLEETGRSYPIRIHSQDVVGVMNMRNIIQHNGWTEVM